MLIDLLPLRPIACVLLLGSLTGSAAGDELLLRDFTRIRDAQLRQFDEDGVVLQDGRLLGWDQIQRGTVSGDRQAAFDQFLEALGEPLFRIRKRLAAGDYRELSAEAESLYERYRGRQSGTAYVVCQAVMWSRQARGLRESAVEPYLRCFRILRTQPDDAIDLPGERRLTIDRVTGMSPDLAPVWFDAQAAKDALPGVLQAVAELPAPRPEGTRVYYGTLALAAGNTEEARRVLTGIEGQQPALARFREIALAQVDVATGNPQGAVQRLEGLPPADSVETQPLRLYWLGVARLQSPDRLTQQAGLLDLMVIPAVYSDQHPELAAAALYRAVETVCCPRAIAIARRRPPGASRSLRPDVSCSQAARPTFSEEGSLNDDCMPIEERGPWTAARLPGDRRGDVPGLDARRHVGSRGWRGGARGY